MDAGIPHKLPSKIEGWPAGTASIAIEIAGFMFLNF